MEVKKGKDIMTLLARSGNVESVIGKKMTKILQVKNYSTRRQLEAVVNDQITAIHGTREELACLGLSDRRKINGVPCVITDTPTEDKLAPPKPNRGKIFESKFNGQIKKLK